MRKKRERRGFTLIELMVVILIVGILAAVAIPLMRGRIDAAKWSEGKAIMGTIATSLRAYGAEKGASATLYGNETVLTLTELGFVTGDLTGTYFLEGDFKWVSAYPVGGNLTYTITCTPTITLVPTSATLTQAGIWGP